MKTVALLLPALLFGCATDADSGDQLTDEDLASETSAVITLPVNPCPINHNPGAADQTWTVGSTTKNGIVSNYGTGQCDAYKLAVRNTNRITVKPYIFADADEDSGDLCAGTKLTMSRYVKSGSSWSYQSTVSGAGVFDDSGCHLELTWDANTTGEVLVLLRATVTKCAGQFCATSRGYSMRVSATPYTTPGPS